MSGDSSTAYLRRSLEASGFDVRKSGITFQTGIEATRFGSLQARVLNIREATGKKPLLVGWSLGGLYARALAHAAAKDVAMIMSLGSPFSGPRTANRAWRLYNLVNDHSVDSPPIAIDVSCKPPVFTIAAWSRRDGIVSVASAQGLPEESDETLELPGSHFDLGTSSRCVRPVIERLGRVPE
ncbi:alpha/beta fold hydrolase [Qipengyuania sp. RS5-5]|uniref:Alpha/beta fold hydrolase n=2 Tax=Parerythrobacter lacustris TaxID=2969984 RepID=A0ABT1XR18_9SPHN|nr:alpha/beta fold hydrolase [Parerythrobacter lacustris]